MSDGARLRGNVRSIGRRFASGFPTRPQRCHGSNELSQSTVEISRRVQDSNSVASEAVKQASATDQRMAELSATGDQIGPPIRAKVSSGTISIGA